MSPPPRVLLVEDNPDDVMLLERALARVGLPHTLTLARDGARALERLADPAEAPPDVILLDLRLPRVDGKAVLAHVRATHRTARVPVVLFTSSAEDAEMAECYHLGANSYVQKPVDFREYATEVPILLHYWLALNVPPGGGGAAGPIRALPALPRPPVLSGRPSGRSGAAPGLLLLDGDPERRARSAGVLTAVAGRHPVHAVESVDALYAILGANGAPSGLRLVLLDADLPDAGRAPRGVRDRVGARVPVVAFGTPPATPAEALAANGFVRADLDADTFAEVLAVAGYYWCFVNRVPPAAVMARWERAPG